MAESLGLTCAQEELLVSLMPLGALSASLVAHHSLSLLGRKVTIQLTALVFTGGALVMALSPGLGLLLVGRFVVGFAVSLSAMAECLYISEISDKENRGLLVSLNELGITLGFLLAYIVNYIFMEVEDGWRYMFGLSSVLSVSQLLALSLLPPTPHFLVMRQRDSEAAKVLAKMRGNGAGVRQEVANIRASCLEAEHVSCSSLFSSEDNLRGRLFLALGLVILQQLTGQPNILYYATDVFQAVGFCGPELASVAAVGLGLVKVLATVAALCLVDRLGRRTLLLAGVSLMAAALLCLVVFAGYQHHVTLHVTGPLEQHVTCVHYNSTTMEHSSLFIRHNGSREGMASCQENKLPAALRYGAFAAIVTFVAAYSVSFGPVTWVLLSELFPLGYKGRAMSLGQAVNWTANVFVSVTFLDAVRIFSLPAIFLFYLVMCIVSLAFVYLWVPETRNKTLEQISRDLKKSPRLFKGGGSACWQKLRSFGFLKGRRSGEEQRRPQQFVRLEEEPVGDNR